MDIKSIWDISIPYVSNKYRDNNLDNNTSELISKLKYICNILALGLFLRTEYKLLNITNELFPDPDCPNISLYIPF